ncbi:hypothetical protein BV20DRAFT_587335 [Pilatotrama ljubarskyi]|nr:hypothetical protein BV20DRAFT_587335 [Pilatotrama ljubarskyi]
MKRRLQTRPNGRTMLGRVAVLSAFHTRHHLACSSPGLACIAADVPDCISYFRQAESRRALQARRGHSPPR